MKATVAVLMTLLLVACGSTVSQSARRAAAPGGDQLASTPGAQGIADTTGASASAGNATPGAAGGAAGARAGAKATSNKASAAATGPIQIGIVRTGVSNAAAFGVSLGNTVTETDVYNAIIAAVNERGGIAGHQIQPIYGDTDTAHTNWDADFEAVCQKFTQDNHVVAVLGFVFDFAPGFEDCLAKKGIPHLSTSFNIPDATVLRDFPLLVALSTPRIERRSQEKIDGGLATGVITKTSRLGVVLDSCTGTERAWTNATEPYIVSKGLTIASKFMLGCGRGSADAGAEAGQAGNLILQFRTAGVDTVMVDGVSEGPAVLILANAAEGQQWHPRYVVSSLANAAVLAGQIPNGQAANVHGYGWLPIQDVNPDKWPGRTASQDRCETMLQAKGIVLKSATDYSYAFNLCEAIFVYERALTATASRTTGTPIVAAIEAMGSGYVSAMNLDGRSVFGRTQHDAPALARYFAWDTSCSCFTYRATTFPIR